jgi:uncharacterized damage-inducible protein DinB
MSSTTTNNAVAPVAMIFSFNEYFVPQALEGLTQEELWRAPTSHNNCMLWVAGHVVQTRATVVQLLGEHYETGWGNLFDRGTKVGDAKLYPSGAEVARIMREVSSQLRSALSNLKDQRLSGPASLPIPGVKTFGDELAFFALHDSYHVGQLAYIRRSLGYPGLAG